MAASDGKEQGYKSPKTLDPPPIVVTTPLAGHDHRYADILQHGGGDRSEHHAGASAAAVAANDVVDVSPSLKACSATYYVVRSKVAVANTMA